MRLTSQRALQWLDDVSQAGDGLHYQPGDHRHFSFEHAAQWRSDASACLHAVLPSGHELLRQWESTWSDTHGAGTPRLSYAPYVHTARSIVRTARKLFESGRLSSFVDGIRAETVEEVLEQAGQLASEKAAIPAVVLAGGALETHLRHLCDRAGLLERLQGHGSIDKYKGLLDSSRKNGDEIVSKNDSKQLVGWAGLRNTAAHDPTRFEHSLEEVRLMISGIEQFVARTA
ncbi:MAG: hypothetical protein RLP09_41795 [Sandaracinaceae bacterium]